MKATGKVTVKTFLKCPACGALRKEHAFKLAKHPGYPLQVLTQTCVGMGHGRGKDGEKGRGAFIWDRRPMTARELKVIGSAVLTTSAHIEAKLGDVELSSVDYDYVMMLEDPELTQERFEEIKAAYCAHVGDLLDAVQERLNANLLEEKKDDE